MVIPMSGLAEPNLRRNTRLPRSDPGAPEIGSPGLDLVYTIAEAVMDVAGPLFWAILALAFITGPLGISLFH
jgi:hypothetical protein